MTIQAELGSKANEERARRVFTAVASYSKVPGVDPECAFRDLLSDLCHYADCMGLDLDEELRCARMNYEAEVDEERRS
jgi:hypothetical protein